jgi:sec-independent protein translocase protein TatB
MFGIDGWEFALVVLLAVLILGPKELPQAMRTMAKVLRKVRGLASEFQGHFNDMVREAELEDVQKSVQQLSSTSVGSQVNKMIDPKGEIGDALRDDPLKDNTETATDSAASAETAELSQVPTVESEPETGTGPAAEAPRGQTS